MGIARQSTLRGLYLANRNICYHARYYGWEPKEEDLEEIISHTSFFDINIDDAIYEVLTMPREEITI